MSDVNAENTSEAADITAAVEKVLVADATAAATAKDYSAIVEAWFQKFFPDSPVSRTVETYNYVRAAADALKKDLAA